MTKFIMIAAALILTAGTAFAAGEAKVARPVACLDYSIAKLSDGSSVGMCQGKKPRLIRSYVVTRVTNPDTSIAAQLLVGFP